MIPTAVTSPREIAKETKTMKFEEINKKYTEKVAEWMAKGYWINAGTMSGSQGEYAHIDLTNGKELIRVLMEERAEWLDDGWSRREAVVIVVGRVPAEDRVRIGATDRLGNTVWNNHLEELEKESYFKIGDRESGWFGTKEEANARYDKAHERWTNAHEDSEFKTKVFRGAEKMMLPFVRRQVCGCKTAKASDITKVEKVYNTDPNGRLTGCTYYVTVKGKRVRLA